MLPCKSKQIFEKNLTCIPKSIFKRILFRYKKLSFAATSKFTVDIQEKHTTETQKIYVSENRRTREFNNKSLKKRKEEHDLEK